MRNTILTFFYTLIFFVGYAETNDSIIFSRDGKCLLFRQFNENRFDLCYYKDSILQKGFVVIENDSAFVFTYKKLDEITNIDSIPDHFHSDSLKLNEFLNKNKLSLKGNLKNDLLSIKTDTIKSYRKKYKSCNQEYEDLFFDLQITINIKPNIIYKYTVTTNNPENSKTNKSDFRLYISEDDEYFYLVGWINEVVNQFDGIIIGSPIKVEKYSNYYR